MPRAAYRYRDESNTDEVDRRFFMLEGRFAELSESLGELWETVPIIPIWSPTIRSGYAPGVTGVEHEWGAVLDYTAIVAAP